MDKTPKIILILGGARSGKSSYALEKAEKLGGKKLFIATATETDAEMKIRIQNHRKARSRDWDTDEVPISISETLKKKAEFYNVILIDCLTLWLFNVMESNKKAVETINTLVADLQDIRHFPYCSVELSAILIVSNEIGLGIVPENKLARTFRDEAGRLNQKIAGVSDEVYFMVSGMPLELKK